MRPPNAKRIVPGLALAAATGILIALAVLGQRFARDQMKAARWVEHTHEVIESLMELVAALGHAEAALGANDRRLLEEVNPAIRDIRASYRSAQDLTRDNPLQMQRIDALEPIVARRVERMRIRQRAIRDGADPGISKESITLSEEIRATVAQMIATEHEHLAHRTRRREQETGSAQAFVLASVAASLLFIGIVVLLLLRETRVRTRAERDARAKHTLVNAIIEGSNDAIFVKEADGSYRLINSAGAAVLGKTAAEIVGKTDRDLFPPEIADSLVRGDLEVLRSGHPQNFELQLLGADAAVRTLLMTKVPHRLAGDAIDGVIGIARDITQRKKVEDDRLAEMSHLIRLGDMLQACRTLQEAYDVIGKLAPHFFADVSGALYLFHASRDHLEPHAAWGEGLAATEADSFLPDDCWALRRGQAHYTSPGGQAIACKHSTQDGAALCQPMLGNGEVLGILHLRSGSALSPVLRQRAGVVADTVAMALGNLQLRETLRNQSIRDPLTGLFNRRYTEETLTRELHRAERSKHKVAVLAIDVDHFKKFNDTYGHQAGDQVLREIAATLARRTRGGDVVSRMGGEELLVILPGAEAKNAVAIGEQIRIAVSQLQVKHLNRDLGAITISTGVAVFPEHATEAESLLRAADLALYRAKREGRDRVVLAELTLPPPAEQAVHTGSGSIV